MAFEAGLAKVLMWRCRANEDDAVVCLTTCATLKFVSQNATQNHFPNARMPTRHVFVYGTLRRREQRDINLLKPTPRWVGRASVEGVLYDLGGYAGLVLGIDQHPRQKMVRGEVYEISDGLELLLDVIEEVAPRTSGEYAKGQLLVHLTSADTSDEGGLGQAVTCLVQEVTQNRVTGRLVIFGGDWVRYQPTA